MLCYQSFEVYTVCWSYPIWGLVKTLNVKRLIDLLGSKIKRDYNVAAFSDLSYECVIAYLHKLLADYTECDIRDRNGSFKWEEKF